MSKEQFDLARELIEDKRYDEARDILESIDHPTAQKWLDKLDNLESSSSSSALMPQTEKAKNGAVEQQLAKARSLLEQKRYDEARSILIKINHPTARKWLAQIDGNFIKPQASPVQGPGCLVQGVHFLFIGAAATVIWTQLTWIFMLTVIGIPLSMAMLDYVSTVMLLRAPTHTVVAKSERPKQRGFIIRAFWFLFFGWWLSGLWMNLALFLTLIIIGLPIGLRMFAYTPSIMTLRRR